LTGRVGVGWWTILGSEATAFNSGLLEIICWALETTLPGGLAEDVPIGVLSAGEAGEANASSASFSVTLWPRSRGGVGLVGELLSKSNFPPS